MPSPEEMAAAVAGSVEERTGRSMDAWAALGAAARIDPLDQVAVRRWLRQEHGVLQNTQWAIADECARRAGWARPPVEEYVAGQYLGRKAVFRPVFDAVRDAALALGPDVRLEGRSSYTPFVRARQCAAVAVTTTRLDLGLRLPAPPPSRRLEPATAPGQSTHRVTLRQVADVDGEVRALLRAAYDQNG